MLRLKIFLEQSPIYRRFPNKFTSIIQTAICRNELLGYPRIEHPKQDVLFRGQVNVAIVELDTTVNIVSEVGT